MQGSKKGYILLEWMICFFLLVLISCLTYHALVAWQQMIRSSQQMLNDLLPIHLAGDMLRQDISYCNQDALKMTHDQLTIIQKNKRITWLVQNNRLVRTCSLYDTNSYRWRKPVSSLMATKIEKVAFAATSFGCIQITLHSIAQKPMIFIAGIRNERMV